jgi:short-subunit dehydrogenase
MSDCEKGGLAFVTGASSGIGKQLCRIFADEGIDLIITARNVDRLTALAEELRKKVNVVVCPADLSDRKQRRELIDKIHSHAPNLVVNNAGWGYYGEALTYETRVSMEMLEVDAAAVLELSLEAARAMISKGKKGVIMNVSSAAAFQIFPCFSVYAASKAFVNLFSESFDEEMRPYGIRVLAACPGTVDTNFRAFAANESEKRTPSQPVMSVEFAAGEIWRQIKKRKPLHIFNWKYRLGTFLSYYLLPKRFVVWILRRAIKGRHAPRQIIKNP